MTLFKYTTNNTISSVSLNFANHLNKYLPVKKIKYVDKQINISTKFYIVFAPK